MRIEARKIRTPARGQKAYRRGARRRDKNAGAKRRGVKRISCQGRPAVTSWRAYNAFTPSRDKVMKEKKKISLERELEGATLLSIAT